ncbi:MAG TPA: cytochrome P450 [Acetobacteraceae bacterium]|nr:cytochrome P450 [Acetobacteraceae bacterium]
MTDRDLGTRDAGLSADSGDAPDGGIVTLSIAELDADPHGVFRRYRPLTPFIAHESGSYIVLRAGDVERFSRDPRLRQSETEYPEIHGITGGLLFDLFKYGMLMSNGAVHRQRRSPFSRTFAAKLIMEMRPRIRRTAEELVTEWYEEEDVDLVQRYAALIPARTISDLLGLPKDDIPEFTSLVYQVTRVVSFLFQPEDLPELEEAARRLFGYVEEILSARRRKPREDFLSAFVASADAAGELSPFEIITQIVTLIIGGTDTTRVAAAEQVALLLQDRAQWDEVCRDPALIPGAVVEALRYEPSVASLARIPLEDIEVDGRVLPAGQFLILSTMSAMRDEQLYARPDVFDIHRTDHPRLPLVFGGGPHRCLGEALARVELEEGLAVLSSRIPQLELAADPPRVEGHSGIRRIGEMRVAWRR